MTTTDQITAITGANPRLTICRHLTGFDQWAADELDSDGNYKPAAPEYIYMLQVDGRCVDQSMRKAPLVKAARENGADYIAEVDAR